LIPLGYTVLLLCGPLMAVAAVWVAERIGVPFPVLLVPLGALFYLVPWIGTPEVPPEIVFYVFLPPLVYYAALYISPEDLRANAGTLGLLAVGLVVVTAATVAGVLVGIAGLPLAVGVVAGVVVAPTDPVSAVSVFRRLDVPERLSTIVEAEGLTNDGTALVLYEGAVGTVVAGAVQPGHLALTLVAAPVGGAALGLAIAWLLVQVRQRMDQSLLQITVSLATPYLTYSAAQAIHLSGVLAAVTAGVYTGSQLSRIYTPVVRLQAFAFLDVLVFLLNAMLFILLGTQLVHEVHWVRGGPLLHLLLVLSATIAVVIASRLLWMLLGPAIARLLGRHGTSKDVVSERVLLGWAGMRGGVSLAAALAIPLKCADGSPFPDREFVIVVAGAVIVATLLVQGTSMPWLLRRLGLKAEDFRTAENVARLTAARAALTWLGDRSGSADTDPAVDSVRARYEARVRRLQADPQSDQASGGVEEMERYRELRLQLLNVERSAVLGLRREGRINATLLRTLERDLDLEEARLRGS
jgi:CPA1 family monovalent cation:H+ antiporter